MLIFTLLLSSQAMADGRLYETPGFDYSLSEALMNTAKQAPAVKNGLKIEECFYKLDSLKGVLRSKTSAENKSMFLKCGFKKCYKLLQYLNFEGYLLLKD